MTSSPWRHIIKTGAAVIVMAVAALLLNSYLGEEQPSNQAMSAEQTTPQAPPAPPVVGHVVENADLSVGREYVGKVEPIQTVFLRPRASGQIETVHFKDGSLVKEGDLLFTIDDKQYQATVSLRRADLSKAEAGLSRASKYNERLKAADTRSVSALDLDIAANDVVQGKAVIEQARATLKLAQLDLGYTKVTAPISGRIGRAEFTKGNFVSPAGGHLTTIVQTDPIRVSFAVADRDYLEQIEAFRSSGKTVYDATIRLANGDEYPFKGERDFEDSAMDEKTGTITVHLRFKNDGGTLVPGAMVRVATKPTAIRVSPVVPQEAIMADASSDYVYVIDENKIAHRRDVSLGVEIGTAREVISGLSAGEHVILRGLQNLRPETPVSPSYLSTPASGKTPADLARESGYDLPSVGSSGDVSGDSAERKN
ncbi:MAG: efflux RND transporter periplasmic adaptor subunit [Synergistaceae bacterium]|jgi:RND family efflux transporter MFP subunit|nr:efflux RND transporter periplasmic adaptor subunit [Synergistaceae bacterium]